MPILDGGIRREFKTGAVRDISEGKGRMDLIPFDVISLIAKDEFARKELGLTDIDAEIASSIELYKRNGDIKHLIKAIVLFIKYVLKTDFWTALMELSKQYEAGAKKYSERNWEKGIPLHSFVDSGPRHYSKFRRGDEDEPHNWAFLWNLFGAIWTHENHPELIDLPFKEKDLCQ